MATDKKKDILHVLKRISGALIHGNTQPKLFFLLLSIFLWFLIKLSKEGYVTQIDYPVVYEELPADKRLINTPPKELTLTLRGGGFSIMKHKLRSSRPIRLNVGELNLADTNRYRWDPESEREMLSAELDDNIEILDIKPDLIYFDFSPIEKKRMKVYLKGEKKYSQVKTLYQSPEIKPDSITIWGTEEQLAEIDTIFTKPLTLTAEEDSVTYQVNLALPENEGLKFSHEKVRVKLIYTTLTEGSVEVPVEVINPPADYNINLVPQKVNVTYRVPLRDFEKIKAGDFSLYVDFENSKNRDSQLLKVEFSSLPTDVREAKIRPGKVEFILTERE